MTIIIARDRARRPYPSPRSEARFLMRAVAVGESVESVRATILVPPEVDARLLAFASADPEYGNEIRQTVAYRRHVLEEFDRFAAAGLATRTVAQSDLKVPRSCPQCGKTFNAMTSKQWRVAYELHAIMSSSPHEVVAIGLRVGITDQNTAQFGDQFCCSAHS